MAAGEKRQDEYTQAEFAELVATKGVGKGCYQLDVGHDGSVKMSAISKRWIQKEDFQ